MSICKNRIKPCLNCGKNTKGFTSTPNKYCSVQCQQDHRLKIRIGAWLAGDMKQTNRWLRRALIYLRGNRCQVCGIEDWNGKPMVFEVEHIDGNSENNHHDNVCLICPNCHSQTATYKGANKGNGRHTRRQRYADGKSY